MAVPYTPLKHCFKAEVEILTEKVPTSRNKEYPIIIESIRDLAFQIVEENPMLPSEAAGAIKSIESNTFLINFVASNLTLSLDEKQNNLAKIIQKENKISLQEFLRRKIENEPLPNPERNKILLQFYSNFNRIKNFFDSRIWEEEERRNFKKLLTETCEEILKNIRK